MQSAPKTLADVAYRALRAQILDGSLVPGEKLRVEHLREQFGVGSTPLREALSRLSSEKLVHVEGQRGFRVAPMSLSELDDVGENRILLEARAVELSVKKGGVEWEASVVAAHHTIARAGNLLAGKDANVPLWDAYNDAFHQALVSACGSPWLIETRHVLFERHSRYRALAISLIQKKLSQRDIGDEHESIARAALARKSKLAGQLVSDHIRATANDIRAALADRLPS